MLTVDRMAEEYKSLLSGSFELAGLPDVPSKLIRVYLACTPTGKLTYLGISFFGVPQKCFLSQDLFKVPPS